MDCPRCIDATLDVTKRAGIDVDTCPQCRGIWLDRGEIERLVASLNSAGVSPVASIAPADFAPKPSSFGLDPEESGSGPTDSLHGRDDDDDDDDDRERNEYRRKSRKRKTSSVLETLGEALEEIFDL